MQDFPVLKILYFHAIGGISAQNKKRERAISRKQSCNFIKNEAVSGTENGTKKFAALQLLFYITETCSSIP